MNKNELHLPCSCMGHELHFEKDESLPKETTQLWFVSFWERGYHSLPSWKYRIKCIWQILKRGRPYGDEIVLEREHLVELQEYLKRQLETTDK